MRKHIESYLVGIDFLRDFLAVDDLLHLAFQLLNSLGASSRNSLVAGGEDTLAAKSPMQGIQRHQSDRSCAVRVGDDPLMQFHVYWR